MSRKLRKLLVILSIVIIALVLMPSCGGTPSSDAGSGSNSPSENSGESNAAAKTGEPAAGFEFYENEIFGFILQYPIEWMLFDGSISPAEYKEMVDEVFGSDAANIFDGLGFDFSSITAVWLDFENAAGDFVPNANIVVSDAEGLTQNDLKSPINLLSLQDMYEDVYPQMFDDFSSDGNMYGKAFGGNYFAIYKFNYTLSGMNISCYQAMTVKSNNLYVLTFTTHGKSDESKYETIISSLEF